MIATLATDRHDDGVTFDLTLTNDAATETTLEFRSAARVQILVHDARGTLVWDSTSGVMFAMQTGRETIAPGQSRSYAAHWPGATSHHGTFTALARLRCVPPIEAPAQTIEL